MDIVRTVLESLGGEREARLAALLGVETATIGQGFSAVVPVLLGGALRLVESGGTDRLVGMIRGVLAGGNPLDHLDEVLGDDAARARLMETGTALAGGLFGERAGAIEKAIASLLSLQPGTVREMIAIAAPLAMGGLARGAGGVPAADALSSLLGGGKGGILGLLPPGTAALIDPGWAPAGPPPAAPAAAPAAPAETRGGTGRWLPWAVAAAIAVALVFALRSREEQPAPREVTEPAPPMVAEPLRQEVQLPDGTVIRLRQGGVVDMLRRYLAAGDPPGRRFVFEDLAFDEGAERLTPESQPTIDGIAAVMRAYPMVRIRLLGFTDDSGDPVANEALSETRARAVKEALVAAGVAEDRVEIEGRGEAEPVAPNDSEANRAKNRRVELEVVAR